MEASSSWKKKQEAAARSMQVGFQLFLLMWDDSRSIIGEKETKG